MLMFELRVFRNLAGVKTRVGMSRKMPQRFGVEREVLSANVRTWCCPHSRHNEDILGILAMTILARWVFVKACPRDTVGEATELLSRSLLCLPNIRNSHDLRELGGGRKLPATVMCRWPVPRCYWTKAVRGGSN